MRHYRWAALVAAVSLAPIAASAAPNSMLQTLPRQPASTPQAAPSQGSWLTKWFRDRPAAPQAVTPVAPAGVMAYEPPRSEAPTQAWGVQPTPGQAVAVAQPFAPQSAPLPANAGVALAGASPQDAALPPSAEPADRVTDARTLREKGHAQDRAGDLAAAERLYRQAIGVDPTSSAAVNDLGLCLARQGRLEQSTAVLRQAIMMRPDKQLYRNNIATVLIELGRADEALAHLKTAYGPAAAHHNVGQLLAGTGRADEAVTHFREALRLEPALASAREALVQLAPGFTAGPTVAQQGAPMLPPQIQPATQPTPAPQVAYQPAHVAQAPATPPVAVPGPPVVQEPIEEAEPAVPSFPRLLPPVLDR